MVIIMTDADIYDREVSNPIKKLCNFLSNTKVFRALEKDKQSLGISGPIKERWDRIINRDN